MPSRDSARPLDRMEALDRRRTARLARPRRVNRNGYMLLVRLSRPGVIADAPEPLLKAFFAHEEIERTREYLRHGRYWRHLSKAKLEVYGRTAWRAFFLEGHNDAADYLCDASAELALRGLDAPFRDLTGTEFEQAVYPAEASIRADIAKERWLLKALDRFRQQLAKPKN